HGSAEEISHSGRSPTMGHVGQRDAGHHIEQLARHRENCPDAGRCHVDPARVSFGHVRKNCSMLAHYKLGHMREECTPGRALAQQERIERGDVPTMRLDERARRAYRAYDAERLAPTQQNHWVVPTFSPPEKNSSQNGWITASAPAGARDSLDSAGTTGEWAPT